MALIRIYIQSMTKNTKNPESEELKAIERNSLHRCDYPIKISKITWAVVIILIVTVIITTILFIAHIAHVVSPVSDRKVDLSYITKYRDKNIRTKYFNEHSNDMNYFVQLMKDCDITGIYRYDGRDINCWEGERKVHIDNVIICYGSNPNIGDEVDASFEKNNIMSRFITLEHISNISRYRSTSGVYITRFITDFIPYDDHFAVVSYTHCAPSDMCKINDGYYTISSTEYITDYIDDDWSTDYQGPKNEKD